MRGEREVGVYEYEGVKRVVYGGEEIGATFVPVCPHCGRFVKADEVTRVGNPNATCSKCGRVTMPFEGFV